MELEQLVRLIEDMFPWLRRIDKQGNSVSRYEWKQQI